MISQKTLVDVSKKALQWIIGLGLLVYIIFQLSIDSVVHDLYNLNWNFLLLALILKFGVRILCSYKWYILARIHHHSLSFSKALGIHFLGSAVGFIVPFVSTDIVIGYSYYKEFRKTSNSVSSILVDRIIGLYATILAAVIGVILSLELVTEIHSVILIVSVVVLCAVIIAFFMLYLLLHPQYISSLRLPVRLKEFLNQIYIMIKAFMDGHRSSLYYNACLSLVVQMMRIVIIYILALAVGAQAHIFYFMCVVPIIFLLSQLPISASGLGVEEGAFIILLGMVGISTENAFTLSMIGRVLTVSSVLPVAVWVIIGRLGKRNGLKIKEMDIS